MLGFFFKRLLLALITLFLIVTGSFFLQRAAPGGPFDMERDVPPEVRRHMEEEWHLNEPLLTQYTRYMSGFLHWPLDLKRSMKQTDYHVIELLGPRLRVSLSLGVAVLTLSLFVGILFGVISVRHRNTWIDAAVMLLALLGLAIPNFVIGPLLKWCFALKLGWLPESRWVSPMSMVLPVLSLSAIYIATITRLVRSGLLDVSGENWLRTARAKGLSENLVLRRHALRAALIPVVAYLGPAMAGLAVGAVVVERVFSIPGLGNTLVEAAFNRDYTMVLGAVIVYSVFLVFMNLLSDLALAFLDPRTRAW